MQTGAITDLDDPDYVLVNTKNQGLGPSINMALAHIDALRRWDVKPPLVTCYVQDDVMFAKGWLEKLSTKFLQLERPLNLAFASGHSAVEHMNDPRAATVQVGSGMYTNKYIRATCMLARHETWMSMWPIPRIDPEIGQERGRPHDGLGSGVDWHFVRVHEKSVVRSGKTNLIIPGLVVHAGYKESTWLKRELPESESDKELLPKPPPPPTSKPCPGLFGDNPNVSKCKGMTNGRDFFCKECRDEFNSDPEAYK